MNRSFDAIKEFILPESCCLCGEVSDFFDKKPVKIKFGNKAIKSPYCASCTNALIKAFEGQKRFLAENLNAVVLFDYTHEVVQKAIYHIKTTDCDKCFDFFAHLVCEHFDDMGTRNITYIPRSSKLLKQHGFDQSERIISTFVRVCDNAHIHKVFIRNKKNSTPQKTLSSKDRFINAQNSLDLQYKAALPKNIVVFDDVITTGATAETAANLLFQGGAENVQMLFIAGARIIIEERRKQNE